MRRVVEPLVPAKDAPLARRPALGYAMVWTAATLFAVNGAVAKVILESGVSSLRLAQARSAGALVGFGLVILLVARRTLRVGRAELLSLAVFGIVGLALVQLLYFLAIRRLPIGIALLLEYLAPLLVALWARFVGQEPVRSRVWAALALALAGLTLVVELWGGVTLDGWGVAAALAGAGAFAAYILLAERGVRRRDPVSFSLYGFLFATLFWALVQPLWSFPLGAFRDEISLLGNLSEWTLPAWALAAWMVVLGTIVPFWLVVGALRHVSATRVGIIAMLEPVVAAIVAYFWLDESLSPVQLGGGGVVLAAILLAQTAR
jgi:drug/metabolite transporter (DMT)-like permease